MIEKDKRYKVVMIDNSVMYRDGSWFYEDDKLDEKKLELVRRYEIV